MKINKSKDEDQKMNDDQFKEIMETIGIGVDFNSDEIIELNDKIDADIVMETKRRPAYFKFLWIVPLFALAAALFFTILFLSQNKIVKGDVVGASYVVGQYSIVPSSYVIQNRDILEGSDIYVKTSKDPFIGPILKDYELRTVRQVKDLIISVDQDGTKDLKNVPVYDVIYVKNKHQSTEQK